MKKIMSGKNNDFLLNLINKAREIRIETIRFHKKVKECRIASSLSCVELFVTLFYGKILKYNPSEPFWDERDRLIISKGHGSICLYPILADLGFFDKKELDKGGDAGALLGSIPDPNIPGYETVNGSLGHGIGVASGIAYALKIKGKSQIKVFNILGDGELYEGAVWEAIMFCGHHKLNNIIMIIDRNKISMLDYTEKIVFLESLEQRFKSFNWEVRKINGHHIQEILEVLSEIKENQLLPTVVIAETIKGKGVPKLERSSLSHVLSLSDEECDIAIEDLSG